MIDPDNPKESLLDDLQWTEHELKDVIREAIQRRVSAMTFDPYIACDDPRKIVVTAILACPGPRQPEVFNLICRGLDGTRIAMSFSNKSNESTMKIVFQAARFRSYSE